MTLERYNSSTRKTIYRRLATGVDTVMPDFAVRPFVATDSTYRGPELARQRVIHIRLCRTHSQSAPIHMRAHNNIKLKSP